MTIITRIKRYPNWRTPRAKSVSGWRVLSRAAIVPNAVRRPVSTARIFAVPLWTDAPRKTAFVRAERAASGFTVPRRFSTGKDSPVMLASLTRKSSASITSPSAGIRLPAESRMRSPGTIVLTGTVRSMPSRMTRQVSASRRFSSSTAAEAWYSWKKPSNVLASTIARMMPKSIHCCSTSEITAAKIRIRTSGLSNCRRSRRSALRCDASSTLLGPTRRSCAAARSDKRPPGPDPNAALTAAVSWLQ